jgi:hypothetical protein
MLSLDRPENIKGASNNCLFPRLLRQFRARILVYSLYTTVLRAVLSCTHKKILILEVPLS